MKIAAVTACPIGVGHTPMAAKALVKAAGVMGRGPRVEAQGAVCAGDALPERAAEAGERLPAAA